MTLVEKAIAKAEDMMYSDYHINAGIDRKVVTKEWAKDGKERTYIKVYCYTLNGKFKGSYDMGYVDTVADEYVAGEFDLAVVADAEETQEPENTENNNAADTAAENEDTDMTTVINKAGTEINYDAAVELMDDELREQIAAQGDAETEQEFFSAYEEAHEAKFGEIWELSKENPVW